MRLSTIFKRCSPRRKKRSKNSRTTETKTDIAPAIGLDNTRVEIPRAITQALRGKLPQRKPSNKQNDVYLGDHNHVCQSGEFVLIYAWNGTHMVDEIWLNDDEARILRRWLNAVLSEDVRTIDI